ncbi:MAG: excinuclease ABC subunit UvrC [Saprospiraceae bacterium]
MTTEDYKKLLPSLPREPGVYKYIDANHRIIYVGKAKNLKNRIASYFGNKKHKSYKTNVMIKNADRIEYTIVDTEQDALILENTLIKKHQPRYNINLKDGKSFTYMVVKNERFPRVFFTRKLIKDGSTYFGPYTSKWKQNQIFEVIKSLFPLRTCSFLLSEKNVNSGKFKVCLEYHIKNCLAPCENMQTEEDYDNNIDQIKHILKGNLKPVKDYLKTKMAEYAEALNFEQASVIKERLELLDVYQSKSSVVSHIIKDVDVFSISIEEDQLAYVNYLKIVNGLLIHSDTIELVMNLNQEESDVLRYAITHFREKYNSIAPEIIIPFQIEYPEDITITIPQRGDKKQLIELSAKNVFYHMMQQRKEKISKIKKQTPAERILSTLKADLQMDVMPLHIECFDNSNIQGTHPVASCVVFKNARPSKKDYRKFNIKTVEGSDDFASMEEVVYRRYKRLLDEEKSLPQLVVIDGGKGQLSSAMKSIEKLNLSKKIIVIGIAKKLEGIYMAYDSIPLYIDKRSESLKLIQQLRNEAHRFAINFHRDQRSKGAFNTALTEINGIGEKTAHQLLKKFGSIKRIRDESTENIADEIGNKKAFLVKKFLEIN